MLSRATTRLEQYSYSSAVFSVTGLQRLKIRYKKDKNLTFSITGTTACCFPKITIFIVILFLTGLFVIVVIAVLTIIFPVQGWGAASTGTTIIFPVQGWGAESTGTLHH